MTSFGKPITRSTADRHLAGVIDRAAGWNANDDRLISIEGWRCSAATRCHRGPTGDLDIAATLTHWRREVDLQDWAT